MAALRVWGIYAPRDTRLIVAAPSRAAAHRAFNAARFTVSMSHLTSHGCCTGNEVEIAVATAKPGAVFASRRHYSPKREHYTEVTDLPEYWRRHEPAKKT